MIGTRRKQHETLEFDNNRKLNKLGYIHAPRYHIRQTILPITRYT